MLTVAKRNAAWAYFGMAVRSAYALGLHRKDTDCGFAPAEQQLRRNIWKSLYVLDCFISAMLGRPNGINARDAPESSFGRDGESEDGESIEADALAASMRASQIVGEILSNVYDERKVSVKLAHRLTTRFHAWKASLPAILHWQNISLPNEDPRTTLAQLHVNLSYFHGIILLTRPFLLQKIISLSHAMKGEMVRPGHPNTGSNRGEAGSASAEAFPTACVQSAVYSIEAVQSALLKRALPRRDPFVIYWLFSAALIVFSNGFANVCTDVDTAHAMRTALNLHQYLGEVDPLARRYNHILVAFHAAISRQERERAAANRPETTAGASSENIFNAFFGGSGGMGAAAPAFATGVASTNSMRRRESINQSSSNKTSNANTMASATQAALDWQPFFQQPSSAQNNPMPGAAVPASRQEGGGLAGAGTGISPPDYCLDFDAFFNNVGVGGSESAGQSQDIYNQDPWMSLYGTMDVT